VEKAAHKRFAVGRVVELLDVRVVGNGWGGIEVETKDMKVQVVGIGFCFG